MTHDQNLKNLKTLFKSSSAVIPIIQRDYAQGRSDSATSAKRRVFLLNLFEHLKDKKALHLDFIYGSDEEDDFVILDGQQRLTTLFLLYWYLAAVEGKQEDFKENFCHQDKKTSRFTYKTRVSAGEFLDYLASIDDFNKVPEFSDKEQSHLSYVLKNRCDFLPFWEGDQTVQSCLNMLDDMQKIHHKIHHKEFSDKKGLYEYLDKITFQCLRMEKYGLSDDLYLKMNARGKALTPFENFKSVFCDILDDLNFEDEISSKEVKKDIKKEIKNKLDGAWLDYFWKFSENSKDRIKQTNEVYFRVFLLLGYLNWCERDFEIADIEYLSGLDVEKFYPIKEDLKNKKIFNEASIIRIQNTFDALSTSEVEDILILDNREKQVKFCAFALFVEKIGNPKDTKEIWKKWKRVTDNLIQNIRLDQYALKDFLKDFSKLAKKVAKYPQQDIYFVLKETEKCILRGFNQQWDEEKEKATLILEDIKWQKWVNEAEVIPYFNGCIRGLLNLCKIEGKEKLSSKDIEDFKKYTKQMSVLFGDKVLGHKDWLLHRSLLSFGNYFKECEKKSVPEKWAKYSFCSNQIEKDYYSRSGNWLSVLENKKNLFQKLLSYLDKEIEPDKIISKLTKRIEEYLQEFDPVSSKKELWRYYMIKDPTTFSQCRNHFVCIRKEGETERILLFKKENFKGLYFCLENYYLWHLLKEENLSYELKTVEGTREQILYSNEEKHYLWFIKGEKFLAGGPIAWDEDSQKLSDPKWEEIRKIVKKKMFLS